MIAQQVRQTEVSWYEATLSLQERRKRGHFSTPPALVEQMLDACGYTPHRDLSAVRVLDPACGSGNFLAAATRRLLDYSTLTNLAPKTRSTLISRNIWGFDPDPISCFLAETQLGTRLGSDKRLHIHQGDALTFPWQAQSVDLFLANPPYLAAKNTDLSGYRSTQQHGQTDSYLLFVRLGLRIVRPNGWLALVLPDPMLARTNATVERTHLLKECTIHHLWHLAGVFAAHVGAVVIIAQKRPPHSTHQIAWLRHKWNGPEETPLIPNKRQVTGGSCPCPPSRVPSRPASRVPARGTPTMDEAAREATTSMVGVPLAGTLGRDGGRQGSEGSVPQALFLRQPRAEFRYLLSQEQGSSIERLRTHLDENGDAVGHCAPLHTFLSIRRGEEIGQSSAHLIQSNPTTRSTLTTKDSDQEDPPTWYPVLRGGRDVHPYAIAFSEWWIARKAIVKPLERYLTPKLLVVKSTGRLQAALDTGGHVALQTLYLLHLRQPEANNEDELYFYLALLNSRLLQTYTSTLHTAYKWVQPQIEQHVLARLPIPTDVPSTEKRQIIERAKVLTRPCSVGNPVVEWKEDMQHLYAEQERAICALYDAL